MCVSIHPKFIKVITDRHDTEPYQQRLYLDSSSKILLLIVSIRNVNWSHPGKEIHHWNMITNLQQMKLSTE